MIPKTKKTSICGIDEFKITKPSLGDSLFAGTTIKISWNGYNPEK